MMTRNYLINANFYFALFVNIVTSYYISFITTILALKVTSLISSLLPNLFRRANFDQSKFVLLFQVAK